MKDIILFWANFTAFSLQVFKERLQDQKEIFKVK
jgi:hypothetical protein